MSHGTPWLISLGGERASSLDSSLNQLQTTHRLLRNKVKTLEEKEEMSGFAGSEAESGWSRSCGQAVGGP